jgi:hypothetical protein
MDGEIAITRDNPAAIFSIPILESPLPIQSLSRGAPRILGRGECV